jgi:hypothetical protein
MMSTQAGDFPAIAPLDVPAPGKVSQPAAAPAPTPPPSPPDRVNGDQPRAAHSSFAPKVTGPLPAIATAQYDPRTGRYVSNDGHVYQQSDLVQSAAAKTWRDMLPT